MRRLAFERHALPVRESQVGAVPGAALALAVAALAIALHHRFAGDFIADRAAGAAAGIGLAHCLPPACSSARAPRSLTTFFQPAPMVVRALSFRGETKPEWTRLRRVPPGTRDRGKGTRVSSGAPYPTLPSCPPFQL